MTAIPYSGTPACGTSQQHTGRATPNGDGWREDAHCKIIPQRIKKSKNKIAPSIAHHHGRPLPETVPVDSDGCVDDVEEEIVEQHLKGRQARTRLGEQAGEGVCAC